MYWYYAYIYCDKDPLSRAIRNMICYLGHRRYLPKTHAWQRSLAFDGKLENKEASQRFALAKVVEELDKVKDVKPGKQMKEPETNKEKESVMWVQRFIARNLHCGGCLTENI
jgi:hypothetical protein